MRRTSRDHAVRFKSLEQALAESPEIYGHLHLLCAGWPCQDNSIAGKRKGLQGAKSGLWSEVARCLRLFKPDWFVGENVPGFLSVNDGKDFCSVIAELQEIGYGLSWRILNSRFFGVAQNRRRLFIVGRFGRPCPPQVLFEEESDPGNHPQKQEMGTVGLCLSTRDGGKQDPSNENLVAFSLGTDLRGQPYKLHTETLVSTTVRAGSEAGNRIQGYVASTLRCNRDGQGSIFKLQGDNIIASADSNREGEVAGVSHQLDSVRGILIGNAVSVPVAQWIGSRIRKVVEDDEHDY